MFGDMINRVLGRVEEGYIDSNPVEYTPRKKRGAVQPMNSADSSLPGFSTSFNPLGGHVDYLTGESNIQLNEEPGLPNAQLGHDTLETTEPSTVTEFEDWTTWWDLGTDPASWFSNN